MRLPKRIRMLTSMSGLDIDLPHGTYLDVGPVTLLPQRQITAELAGEWHRGDVAEVTDWEAEKGGDPGAKQTFESRRQENGRRS